MGGWLADVNWLHFVTIPIFTGVVGWLINWTGLIMLFSPVRFHGVRVPGLAALARVLPRKIQEVPGLLHGGIGWQGIVPARAAKMGSIAVDKAIAKLGTPREFYEQLEPDKIAEHIVDVFEPDMPEVVEEIMRREHPRLWRDLPPWGRKALIERVQAQLPAVVTNVTDEIGEHIDQLLDPKLMVIDQFRERPVAGRPHLPRLRREGAADDGQLRLHLRLPARHPGRRRRPALPPVVAAAGPRRAGRLGHQRARHVADLRAAGAADVRPVHGCTGSSRAGRPRPPRSTPTSSPSDVITLEHIGDFLLDGPRGDRTRQLLADRDAAGHRPGRRPGPRGRAGRGRHASASTTSGSRCAQVAVDRTIRPFKDPEFSREQATKIRDAGRPGAPRSCRRGTSWR